MTQKTPMQLVYASSKEWEEVCNSEVAYSNLAPALLSASVIREERKDAQLATLQAKYDALVRHSEQLVNDFEQFVSDVSVLKDEISQDHYSIIDAKKAIKNFKDNS